MNPKICVLLIEDDKVMCSYLTAILSKNDYQVTSASTGSEGLHLASSLCPGLILLDLGLPDMEGLHVLSQLRLWSDAPILIVSARLEEREKIKALDSGADDYITKPFSPNELLARIRASLRRGCPSLKNVYKASDLEIDFRKSSVCLSGEPIHLTQIEYQLLSLLAQHSGQLMSYQQIMKAIWGPYAEGNNQILRVNMTNIRRKLKENPAQPRYILTEAGMGYRMRENES